MEDNAGSAHRFTVSVVDHREMQVRKGLIGVLLVARKAGQNHRESNEQSETQPEASHGGILGSGPSCRNLGPRLRPVSGCQRKQTPAQKREPLLTTRAATLGWWQSRCATRRSVSL